MNRRLLIILLAVAATTLMGRISSQPSSQPSLQSIAQKAENGDPEALYRMGWIYETGYDSIPADSVLSMQYYRRAAEGGYLEAQNYLGYRLYKGLGTERNIEEAIHWLETAAIKGDPRASSNLGFLLLEGEGVLHDPSSAAFWLERASSNGVASAASMLGDLYRDGNGVEQDSLKAEKLYRLAIDGQLPDAAYKLYALKSSQWDCMSADSLLSYGSWLYLRQVPEVAVKVLGKGAQKGSSQAMALLGDAYTRALGVEYNHAKALEWYARAALSGNAPAQFIIGELLEIFPDALTQLPAILQGCFTDDRQYASYWLQQAALQGVSDSQTANRLLLHPIF